MPELVVTRSGRGLLRIPLSPRGLKIGRSPQSDVILPEEGVSRQHAFIEYVDGRYLLKDTSSAGTRLGGVPIKEKTLADNDEFSIGSFKLLYKQRGLADEQSEASVQTVIRDQNQEGTRLLSLKTGGAEVEGLALSQGDGAAAPMNRLPFGVGSGPENQLILKDEYVSTRHFEVIRREGALLVRDLGSTNGTFINDRRITEAGLKKDDEIRAGQTRLKVISCIREEPVAPLQQGYFCGMVGGASLHSLFGRIKKAAPTDLTVLIQAESGCGKELAARAVHDLSLAAKGPYVIVNCGAISPELIESELFGHEKGAFTGAVSRRIGAFEQAMNGTLFLDEIGELPLSLQPKLLRALENRTIRRVGGEGEIQVNARIIAATHRPLLRQVEDGEFREDLYYRLNVICLTIPPLRERRQDIPLLCEHFLRLSDPAGLKRLSAEALHKLASHNWPGNIRELRNVLLKALVFSDGPVIGARELELTGEDSCAAAADLRSPMPVGDGLVDLNEVEKQKIREALDLAGGQRKKAAELLGIARSTLFKKIKDFGME